MPFAHMHNAIGIALLVAVILIAAVAGIGGRGWRRSSHPARILAAILGIVLVYYLLRRL